MKNIILIAIILVIVLAIWFLFKNKTNQKSGQPEVKQVSQKALTGSGEYVFNATESSIRAEGKKVLIPGYVDKGLVNIKEGSLAVKDGEVTSGSLKIDMNSISIESTGAKQGESMLAKHLKSADFFDAEKFPESVFILTSTSKVSNSDIPNLYDLSGDLTIKEKTNQITIRTQIYMEAGKLKIVGSYDLDRTLWDVRYSSGKFFQNLGNGLIGDIFTVNFNLTANPKN